MLRLLLVVTALALAGFTHIRIDDAAGAPYLRWSKGFQVPIHIHSAGYSRLPFATVRAALESSLATWNAVDNADLTFIRDPAGRDGDTPALDGFNVIRFEERDLPPEIDPDSTLAWTSPLSVACTGILIEADITFNAVSFRWSVDGRDNDIESVSLHEVGHLLGLDHTRDRAAVMFPTVQEDARRALAADDLAGVRAIYPPARGLDCQRNADCGGGEVCLYSLRSDEVVDAFCGLSLGAAGPGARCNADLGPCDSGCANGLCFNDDQCSAVCAVDRDCPAGWTCLDQGDGNRLCVDLTRCVDSGDCPAGQACGVTLDANDDLLQLCVNAGDSADGAPCDTPMDCAGGICLDTCTRLCGGNADCAAGFACTPVDTGAGSVDLCVLPDVPCGRDRDCPAGLACTYLTLEGRLVNRCAPPEGLDPGTACRRDASCRAGLCEDGLCSAVCRNDGDCPETMACGRATRDGATVAACVPLASPPDMGVIDAQVPDPPRDLGVEPDALPPDAATVDAASDAAPPRPDSVVVDARLVDAVELPIDVTVAGKDEGCSTRPGPTGGWGTLLGLALILSERRRAAKR